MPVTMICPNLKCRNTVVAPESARGKIVRCGHCKQLFMVPDQPRAKTLRPEEPVDATGDKTADKV